MMLPTPLRPEIDHRTIKLIVGVIALSLASLASFFSETSLASISAAYYEKDWPRNILVGFLFAIAAFLLAYNGTSTREMVLSKVAAIAALGVAMFPCKCDIHAEIIPNVHGASAAVLFLILAYFCYGFFARARAKGHPEAKARAWIYAVCGMTIAGAIAILAYDHFSGDHLRDRIPRLTFYGERASLIAFGISWLTASRILPFITREDERFSPLSENVPA